MQRNLVVGILKQRNLVVGILIVWRYFLKILNVWKAASKKVRNVLFLRPLCLATVIRVFFRVLRPSNQMTIKSKEL